MKFKAMTALAGALAMVTGGALADADDDTLTINEEIEIITKTDAPAYIDGLSELISGWHFRSDETQQLETDDFDNPGMLGVEAAMEVWETADGSEGKSCADCHESAEETMVGVRAVYPKWNDNAEAVWTLEMAINGCRTERMGAEAWKYDGDDITNMVALISSVSRGMPMSVAVDGPAQATWEEGKELYYTRTGQLDLSCANCHEDNYGNMIRADHLSQGHTNGFPTYRLKNAKLNSVHARFKGCVRDTRAETYAPGSPEFVALELYVASRGNGLSIEGPAVRN